ncbi:MAG: hypothetical protein Tp172DCM1112201_10 [Prokaryotic dsDNA virus sp.]|nr:MAG: hypothetical protein Tp172DCM1112201_10 [Prokaryotic dsDNA virus sp.]
MATFASLVKEVLPYVPECPDSLVADNIRSATIDLCERTKAYKFDLDPISTISGVYEYDFDQPSGTDVHQILYMVYDGKDMDPISPRSLELNYPDWRDRTGQPYVYLQKSPDTFWVVPVPSASKTSSLIMGVALKPTRTSNNIDTDFANNYRDGIIYGALYRLLRMPNKAWSDINAAQEYLYQFGQEVRQAELRARGGDLGVKRTVKYKGIGLPRRRYGRYGKEIDY